MPVSVALLSLSHTAMLYYSGSTTVLLHYSAILYSPQTVDSLGKTASTVLDSVALFSLSLDDLELSGIEDAVAREEACAMCLFIVMVL